MAQWFNTSFFLHLHCLLNKEKVMPKETLPSFLNLDIKKLAEKKKKLVIADLDNTLVLPYSTDVNASILLKIKKIQEAKINFAILSNHAGNIQDDKTGRAKKLAGILGVEILPCAYKKPHQAAYFTYLEKYSATPEQTIVIGDRLLTDILGANLLGIDSVLVDPLSNALDPWFVKIARKFENNIMKWHKKELKAD